MTPISKERVMKGMVEVANGIREGQAIGTAYIAFHAARNEFHCLEKLQNRPGPSGAPSHVHGMIAKNPGYSRQVTSGNMIGEKVLFANIDFEEVVTWVNNRFGKDFEALD